MSTTIDTPAVAGTGETPRPASQPDLLHYLQIGVKALASLRLTVVLFAFSILLVFFGTLAQRDNGIWTVVDEYFWSWVVAVRLDLIRQFGSVFFDMSKDTQWSGWFPLPAGKLLGLAMIVNLLAAHAIRFRLTWKRSGIILIHSGMLLMFLGEYITREYAVEQQMVIDEGASASYTRDSRHYELAFVDRTNPRTDTVTVIPASRLKSTEGRITHPDLPVDIQVRKWMANSQAADPGKKNPATAGLAVNPRTEVVVTEMPEVSGVDMSRLMDLPAAYITLYRKGTDEELGTYLVWLRHALLDLNNAIEVNGKRFEFQLRNTRYYKKYRVELIKFRFDRYPGTNKPKNYSSEVIVYDEAGEKLREQTIRMNEPMRFEGETFYQQGFNPSETGTILQIVRNPGWVLPYVSCAVVGFGLVLHFMIMLIGFLTKTRRAAAKPAEAPVEPVAPTIHGEPPPSPGWFQRNFEWFIPTVITGACVLYLLGVYGRMKPKDNFDLDTFSRLPVLEGGRVKPLDSVARFYLRKISHRSVFEDENGDEQPAIRWYLDTLAAKASDEKDPAWNYKVVRIESDQILAELKLKRREGVRYSVNELRPHIGTIATNAENARKKQNAKKSLDPVETHFIELNDKVGLLVNVAQGKGNDLEGNRFHLVPPQAEGEPWLSYGDFRDSADDAAFAKALTDARARVHAQPGGFDRVAKDFLLEKMLGKEGIARVPPDRQESILDMVMKSPPLELRPDARADIYPLVLSLLPKNEQDELRAAYDKDRESRMNANPGIAAWKRMIDLRRQNKFGEFNAAVAEYRDSLTSHVSNEDVRRSGVEISYNRFAPFLRCIGLYVIAFILSAFGFAFKAVEWSKLGEALRRSAVGVLTLAFLVHVAGLFVRMDLMNYTMVFVTNLYSSAIFIGAGCVGLGLILERVFPIGIGAVVASVLGIATTIVAHNLAMEKDTLEMMEAVLDTNFWLATHVTTVTLGYTATFVAGFLGAAYLFLMFCSVVRDSFQAPGPPAPDRLLAYGAASLGIVFLPLSVGWVLFDALAKFELIPSVLGELLRYGMVAIGGLYFVILIVSRAGADGVDSHGNAVPTPIPRFVKPATAMGLNANIAKMLGQMIYGVVCFAMILSFIGTVLGGIWADQSWGRFWGWDPKENGAVLIVLWNALLLHARWCGLVKVRGIAVLAVIGNIITAWSWFGTNQLDYGLHAYGRNSTLADACSSFWMSMTVLAMLGLIPHRFWSTAAAVSTPAIPVNPPKGKGKPTRRK